jgi:hypothetical protein
MPRLQETALKREYPALQNMKFLYFFGGSLALLDPDPEPATQINADVGGLMMLSYLCSF